MSDDLYTKWLGVPPGHRPPDHYTLLGLPRFCGDRVRIDEAASGQLGKLDAFAIHPDKVRRDACHRMMNEVAAARMLLIDDRRRAQYDQQLKATLTQESTHMDATLEMPAMPGHNDATMEMPAHNDATAEMPAYAAAGGPAAADQHRLLRNMDAQQAQEEDEDDPIARTMAEIQGQPVLDQTAPLEQVARQQQFPWMLVGGVAMFLVAGIVALVLMVGGRPGASEPEAPPTPQPAPQPEPASRGGAVFFDNFERQDPGVEYRLINSPPTALRIEQGQLVLQSPSAGSVRVDLVPQDRKPFEEVTARITLEPGCRVIFGITNAARMILSRDGGAIEIQVTPGYPGTDPNKKRDWPRLEVPVGQSVPVRLFRRRDTVVWAVGDEPLATSPELRALGEPGLTIETSGNAGRHAAVDDLRIWFAK